MLTADAIKANILTSLPSHLGYGRLLSQLNADQGDTLQREGTLAVLLAVCDDADLTQKVCAQIPAPEQAFKVLETSPGWYRRSANPSMPSFETDVRQTSRDQLAIAKAGMVAQKLTSRLLNVVCAQILRLTFHQNYWNGTRYQIPDIMTPDEAAIGLRGLLGLFSVLPNMLLDLSFLVNLMIRWGLQQTNGNLWGWDNMFCTMLLTANLRHPTFWSRLAMRQYLKTDFMVQLWSYHKDSDGNNGCVPLYWLFRLALLTKYTYSPRELAP